MNGGFVIFTVHYFCRYISRFSRLVDTAKPLTFMVLNLMKGIL
ncbi:hypothetical protein CES85_0176 [Ochrobactrum quorumnocens]|uniref:Uncharacterized protein n=1 Tax=Ochrobactrum quorumnocens TaxID=271865 RepID=A0A248UF98_9HYPH|nr:hypothetical protein CES85_0176 [[Ochrobactrum] quorumnocens]